MPMQTSTTARRPAGPAIQLAGVLYRIFPEKQVGAYRITDFILKMDDGSDKRCSSFKPVNPELLGKAVSFSATTNEYRGEVKYVLERSSDIQEVPGYGPAAPTPVRASSVDTPAATPSTPRRGRPRATTAPVVTQYEVSAVEVVEPREPSQSLNELEDVRELSQVTLLKDVVYIRENILNDSEDDKSLAVLVQALQAIRATFVINRAKDRHIADMNRNRR